MSDFNVEKNRSGQAMYETYCFWLLEHRDRVILGKPPNEP